MRQFNQWIAGSFLLFAGILSGFPGAAQWQVLGENDQVSATASDYTSIAAVSPGDSMMAYSYGDTTWDVLAHDDQISAGKSGYTSITTLAVSGVEVPYLAYTDDHGAAIVKNLSGGVWQAVGGTISSGHASYTNLFSDRNGTLYLAYVDNDNGHRLAIKTFNPSSGAWTALGGDDNNLYVSTGSVVNGTSQLSSSHNSWMAFDQHNIPYVVYGDMDEGGHPYVKKFENGAWATVGGGPVNTTDRASGVGIILDQDNTPYICYAGGTGSTGQLVVYGFTGGAWTSMNVAEPLPNGRHTSNIRHPAMTITDGVLYVIYMDTKNSNRATVISSPVGTPDWNQVGGTLSGRDVSYPNIAADAAGNLFASFIDVIANKSGRSVTRVMRLPKGGDTWAEVLSTGVDEGIDEPSSSLALNVAGDNSPYITYLKPFTGDTSTPVVQHYPSIGTKQLDTVTIPYVAYTDDGGSALVKKLAGGSWQAVGGTISSGHASSTNIFSDRNGTLYLAYVDNDNGHRLAVKTFNPTSGAWTALGGNDNNLYVSTGSVVNGTSQLRSSHNSWMAFDQNDVPYVVYGDMDEGGHPYVKKFENGAWTTVGGGPVNTTDKASGVGIALDQDNTPYICYAGGTGSTGQVVVYGFTGGLWTSMNVPEPLPNGRHTSNVRHPAMTIADGVLYVIYMDTKNSNRATVISSPVGTPDWNQVGGTLSGRDISYPNIDPDSDGNLYASFVDVIANKSGRSVTRVMKLEAGSTDWVEEADTAATDGIDEPTSNLALSVGNNHSPYIVYLKPFIGDTSTPVVRYLPVKITKPNDTTVTVKDNGNTVTVSNGIVTATIEKSSATVTSLMYKGVNMLEGGYSGGKIYWSWNMPNYQNPSGCTYTLVSDPKTNQGTYAELQFYMKWDGSASTAAMDVDIYYSLPRTAQGIYASAMLTHPTSYPANPGGEWRMASYVGSMFDWLSVDSLRNRLMASPADWAAGTVPDGAPPEVELLHTGIYAGQYECKYDYSADFGDLNAWGWSSTTQDLGIWVTVPSTEYYNGGPMKRELTGHNGPTLLNMLGGQHYGMGGDGAIAAGEYWQKLYGPFLIYCNSVPDGTTDAPAALWTDAVDQAKKEQKSWPYAWYKNPQYVQEAARGTVTGKLVIADTTDPKASAAGMWVGVAITPLSVNAVTDFQLWSKNYQFWVKTDSDGNFSIPQVLPGTYNLYAFGPGAAGQLTKNSFVPVTAGSTTSLGNVEWTPARTAPTVWQIGIPDRTAAEFRHGKDWWRSDSLPSTHWGKFMDYPDEFPNGVNYTIGKSDSSIDWNFVQPYDKSVSSTSPVWTIKFNLTDNPTPGSTAALYIAYASSFQAANIVTVNGDNISDPSTGVIPPNASDAMIRKGIHGAFGDHRFTFPANLLHAGENEITLTIRITGGGSSGDLMYDYLRLEAWGVQATTKNYQTIAFDSIQERHLNDGDLTLEASATSGLAITYTSSDSSVAYVDGKTLHLLSTGTATITASQPGDSSWLAARDVPRVLNVTVPRNEQSITFDPLKDHYLGEPDFTLSATTTSGLPIQYTSNNPAAATVENGIIHLVAVGPVTITATQPGDDTWLPATTAESFQVRAIDKPSYNKLITPNGDGVNDKLMIENVTAYPANELRVFDESGKMIYHKKGYDNSWDARLSGKVLAKGTYYFILRSNGAVRIKGSFSVIH